MEENKYSHIGLIIKNARNSRGLSQKVLGAKIGRSNTLITHFEGGTHKPSLKDAFKLEIILGLEKGKISYLVFEEDYLEAGRQPSAKISGENPACGFSLKTALRSERSDGEFTSVPVYIEVPIKLPEIILKFRVE